MNYICKRVSNLILKTSLVAICKTSKMAAMENETATSLYVTRHVMQIKESKE